tara:strand:+ start:459 stop:1169 length:711 start_codon:yes stop_codon:yes gene_type:complete
MKREIKVCLSPELFHLYSDRKSLVVVVDILRATSAICIAFQNNVKGVVPVSSVEEALEYKGKKDYILGAERNGKKVKGFKYGNSPLEYNNMDMSNKILVLTTTNGTKTINLAKRDHETIIGSFLNISTLINFLKNSNKNIIFLCCGWRGSVNIEDTLFCGAICNSLLSSPKFYTHDDSALISRNLFLSNDLFKIVSKSSHAFRLSDSKISQDVKFALTYDLSNKIPIVLKKIIDVL